MYAWLGRLFFKKKQMFILMRSSTKRMQERLLPLQSFHPCFLITLPYIAALFQMLYAVDHLFHVQKLCFFHAFGISQHDTILLLCLLVTFLHAHALRCVSVQLQIQATMTEPPS